MSDSDNAAGGLGGPAWLTDGARDQKLVALALRSRWPMDEETRQSLVRGQVKVALDESKQPRDRTRAFMALVAADRENMVAEGIGPSQPSVSVNVGVQVIESDDWYGTRAATNGHITQGNGASANGASGPGEVQGGGLRPTVGQNGNGTNGHAEGPRGAEGTEAGGH